MNYRHVDVVCGRVSEDDIKLTANTGKEFLQLRNAMSFDKDYTGHKSERVVDVSAQSLPSACLEFYSQCRASNLKVTGLVH